MGQVFLQSGADTYSAAAAVASAASATDIAILPGSATKTILVKRVIVSGVQTTAGIIDVLLVKRSTANTGGTSTGMTATPHDSTNAAATAAPLTYTANPTTGSLVGALRRVKLPVNAPASVVGLEAHVFEFASSNQPVVLRGVAEGLAVNLNGVTVTGGSFNIVFEWNEI